MANPGSFQGDVARLVIKNPARAAAEDFRLELPKSCTVQALKEALQQEYAGQPHPTEQTLIYAGRVLKDSGASLGSILQEQLDPLAAHTFHLVVKPASRSTMSASGTSDAAQHTPEPKPQSAPAAQPVPPTAAAAQSIDTAAAAAAAAAESTEAQPLPHPAAPNPEQPPHAAATSSGPATQQAAVSQSAQAQPAESSTSSGAPPAMEPAATAGQPPQYFIMNPVMAAAYQAALAALIGTPTAAAGMVPQHVPMPFTMPMIPLPPHHLAVAGNQAIQPQAQEMAYPFAPIPFPMAPMPFPYQPNMPGQAAEAPALPGSSGQRAPAQPGAGPPGAGAQQPAGVAPPPMGAAQPQVPADGGEAARPHAQVRVRLIRLNLKMLLQLGVFILILYQHCSPSRFFMLLIGGILLYVTAMFPIRRMLRGLVDRSNPGLAGGGGFLREAQVLLLGFVASLLPGWNFNPDDAAAFAAAQELMAAEAAAAAQNDREHQD